MKCTGWTLGILAAVLFASAIGYGADSTDAKEKMIQTLAAKTFAGVKDALKTGNETLASEIIERSLRLAWDQAQAALSNEGAEAAGKTDLGAPGPMGKPAAGEAAPAAKPVKPPMRVEELLAAAREYVAAPAGETQVARQAKQESIVSRLVGRDFILTATLKDVTRQEEDGAFTVNLVWESKKRLISRGVGGGNRPAETIHLWATTSDVSASSLITGSSVTVRARLAKMRCQSGYGGTEAIYLTAEEAQLNR